MRAVVLGGGIAGLTVGSALARSGADTTVVEAAPFPGGLASGFRDRGYTFDFFSHRLWTRDGEVLRLVEGWVESRLLVRRKISRILLDGKLYNYPIDLRDLLKGGSARLAVRAIVGYAAARIAAEPPREDFRGFMISRYGAPLYDTFFGPYTEKLCGCSSSEISMDLALGAVPQTGILTQLIHRLTGRMEPWDDFLYPAGGFHELPQGMARDLTRSGGKLLLGHAVRGVRSRAGRVVSVEAASGPRSLDLPADLVVSTIPLIALLKLLQPAADREALEAAAALRHRAMVAVYLGIRRERVSEDHWIYVSDPAIRFNRLSETTNYSEAMAPPGRTGICAEIACDVDDRVFGLDEAQQTRRVVDDLVKIGLLRSKDEVEASWVRRFPGAYPVYRVDYKERLAVVESHLRRIGNLEVCGRQGAFWYGSTAQGIRQGLDLVSRLLPSAALAA